MLPRRMLHGCFALLLACLASGCVPLLVGAGVGVLGGYAVSRDTFEGVTGHGQDEIWDAAVQVTSIMGEVSSSDRKGGEILAHINAADVTVSVLPVNLTTTKIRIKARRGIFPRIATAQEVYTKIINQLEK